MCLVTLMSARHCLVHNMCVPGMYGQRQSSGPKTPMSSLGSRLDQAHPKTTATAGGGTYQGTILQGTPRNSGVDALRKTTMLGV